MKKGVTLKNRYFVEIDFLESLPSLICIFSPIFSALEFFACPTSCVLATAKEDGLYS